MKAEGFDLIKNDLSKRVADCDRYLASIHTTDDISDLTISKAKELRDFCKSEYLDMTKIAMVDFYHIIGMGGLTVIQMNIFISLMKKYLSYRPLVQTICAYLTDFDNLPKIPVRTSFKLTTLASGLELTSGPEDGYLQNGICDIEDYHKAKAACDIKDIPSITDNNGTYVKKLADDKTAENTSSIIYSDEKTICGSLNDLAALRFELIASGISDAFVATIIASLTKGCSELQCAGIKWKVVGNTFVGTAKTDSAKSIFAKAYSNKGGK